MSNLLMKILIGEYIILALVAVGEGRVILCMYWVGAVVLNIAVFLGLTK